MALAGARKGRHRSWIRTVAEPGSKGCTCKMWGGWSQAPISGVPLPETSAWRQWARTSTTQGVFCLLPWAPWPASRGAGDVKCPCCGSQKERLCQLCPFYKERKMEAAQRGAAGGLGTHSNLKAESGFNPRRPGPVLAVCFCDSMGRGCQPGAGRIGDRCFQK